ncbi:TPA: hypothetical protein ACX6SV_000658 [Photobacterium damselae]
MKYTKIFMIIMAALNISACHEKNHIESEVQKANPEHPSSGDINPAIDTI